MSVVQDHPDIEKLPLEIDGNPVRETIREIFRNPENGTPDNISKAGCLALAEKGSFVWNAWRVSFETLGSENVIKGWENKVNFEGQDFDPNDISWLVIKDFRNFVFGHQVSFWGAKFQHVNFSKAKFGFGSSFQRAIFAKPLFFCDARFGGMVSFRNATFSADTLFNGSRFEGGVDFSVTTESARKIAGMISFEETVFCDVANFNDRQFGDSVIFRNAKFMKSPPSFHGCELHQDTSFEGAQFPEPTGSEEAARAYRTLKLAFSKQQAIREEQRFFRLEMEEETLRETGLKRWLFKAYKTFSDYGFSIMRPLKYGGLSVLALTAVYGLLSWLGQCGLSVNACHFAPQWLEFSLLQTLPLPGLDKLSETASKAFWPAGAWWGLGLSILVIIHKTISLAALFLIGLALRNLFKLK